MEKFSGPKQRPPVEVVFPEGSLEISALDSYFPNAFPKITQEMLV